MNVVFEEDGSFKAASVLSDGEASLQVELAGGRRIKVKATNVVLRFEQPGVSVLMDEAEKLRTQIDLPFLWECAPAGEFGFAQLAQEYFSENASVAQQTALLQALHGAPVYFHRKGRGRYAKAPAEILKAALAALERKQQQQQQIDSWVEQMLGRNGSAQLPPALSSKAAELLFAPDKMSMEYRALQAACAAGNWHPQRLLLQLGAFQNAKEIFEAGFMREHFPQGRGFPSGLSFKDRNTGALANAFAEKFAALGNKQKSALGKEAKDAADAGESAADAIGALAYAMIPLAKVQAFSVDDSSTTEIDDCLSVSKTAEGWRIGVHIAAPALAIKPRDPLDKVARARMSTVYMPGDKITMLPEQAIRLFSLDAGREVPVLSIYANTDENVSTLGSTETRVERLVVAANLRHDQLDAFVTPASLEAQEMPQDWAQAPVELSARWKDLQVLWAFTKTLTAVREQVRGRPEGRNRSDYTFSIDHATDSVTISERQRDAPLDRIVAELMILANSAWGKLLADNRAPGIYRSQAFGRVKMTIHPQPHQGLGVAQYGWCTSPLRRYTDLVNQRQIIAVSRADKPPYVGSDADLFAVISQFDAKYSAYGDHQSTMERYWCLRWILQQQAAEAKLAPSSTGQYKLDLRMPAVVVRDELVRLAHAPYYFRLANLPAGLAPGRHIWVQLISLDLLDLAVEARFAELGEGGAEESAETSVSEPPVS